MLSKRAPKSATVVMMSSTSRAVTKASFAEETRARHVLVASTVSVAIGILLAGTLTRNVGGAITLVGWALGLYGLHTYGRLGRTSPRRADPTTEAGAKPTKDSEATDGPNVDPPRES
jgi:hypothetical protein